MSYRISNRNDLWLHSSWLLATIMPIMLSSHNTDLFTFCNYKKVRLSLFLMNTHYLLLNSARTYKQFVISMLTCCNHYLVSLSEYSTNGYPLLSLSHCFMFNLTPSYSYYTILLSTVVLTLISTLSVPPNSLRAIKIYNQFNWYIWKDDRLEAWTIWKHTYSK